MVVYSYELSSGETERWIPGFHWTASLATGESGQVRSLKATWKHIEGNYVLRVIEGVMCALTCGMGLEVCACIARTHTHTVSWGEVGIQGSQQPAGLAFHRLVVCSSPSSFPTSKPLCLYSREWPFE